MDYKELIKVRTVSLPDTTPAATALKHSDLKQWLDKLPPLHPKSTVQQLLNALQTNNQLFSSKQQQFKILQEYRSIIMLINPSLNLDALKRLSIKEEDRELILIQTNSLYLTLADGYKQLLKELMNETTVGIQANILLPLYHAIEALSLTLLHSYRTYQTAPRFLFHDIHLLYQLATDYQLTGAEVDTGNLSLAANSIDSLYKQTMYLSCLDPYHLPTTVAEKLYERLSRLARYFDLNNRKELANTDKLFFIDPAEDAPPRHISRLNRSSNTLLLLDPTTINEIIKTEILKLQAEGSELAVQNEIKLLRQLIINKDSKPLRYCERKQASRPCKITFGIDAVNHFLTLPKHEFVSVLESSADSFGQHLIESWSIVNESTEGLCLTFRKITRYDIRIGDILGLLTEESIEGKKNGKIGIVRWLRSDLRNHIHIGVQLIHGNLLPAMCRLIDSPNVNNTFPAIFVSSLASANRPATLVTAKNVYHENRIMEVSIGEQPMRIKTGKRLTESFAFDQFAFCSINS